MFLTTILNRTTVLNVPTNAKKGTKMAWLCKVKQPDTDRLVIVQDVDRKNRKVHTIGMRYREGRWFGEETEKDLTECLSDSAIWGESFYCAEFFEPRIKRTVNLN